MSRRHLTDRQIQNQIRKAALKRAGHRSEQSGLAGRLECHHLTPLAEGGKHTLNNVIVLTREEHISLHRPQPDPDREAWSDYLEEQINAPVN